jgi:DNA-directed RNA polymerase subunit N (RpoN/RPB10)
MKILSNILLLLMLYIKCPTCGRLLADKMLAYASGLEKIHSNDKLTDEQKNAEIEKLLDTLKIPKDNYCCRTRLMTYRKLIEIIK